MTAENLFGLNRTNLSDRVVELACPSSHLREGDSGHRTATTEVRRLDPLIVVKAGAEEPNERDGDQVSARA